MTCFTKPPLSTDLPADVLVKISVWRPPVWDTYSDGGLELPRFFGHFAICYPQGGCGLLS